MNPFIYLVNLSLNVMSQWGPIPSHYWDCNKKKKIEAKIKILQSHAFTLTHLINGHNL